MPGSRPSSGSLGRPIDSHSRRIAAIEKALGAELVARTPEGMALTEAGRIAVAAARRIDSEIATLADLGVSVLPCYLAVTQPLVRITEQVVARNDVYAVFLPERRAESRLRVVIDALVEMFAQESATLCG